jgi:hypothetical protein
MASKGIDYMKFFIKDVMRISTVAVYATFCFTFLAYAESQISPKQPANNSVITEHTTPPAAEGPLTEDDIQPLLLSEKTPAKEQNPAGSIPQAQ